MNYKTEYGLPNSLKGKSFAEASKHIENTFKGRNSVFDLNTKKELLSRLKDVQEQQRMKLEEKTKKAQGEMKYGGYDGEIPEDLKNQMVLGQRQNASIYEETKNNPKSYSTLWDKTKDYLGSERGESLLGGLGLGISALAPIIANKQASKSITQAKEVNPMLMDVNQMRPEFVNRQQLLRGLSEQAGTQRYNMSQVGGNWGQYSQGMAGLNASLLGTTGNLMLQSDLADAAERVRVQQGRMGIQQFNIGQQQRADEINAQNLAAYQGTKAAYKQATGANIGAIGQSLFNYITARKVARSAGNTYGYNSINPNERHYARD